MRLSSLDLFGATGANADFCMALAAQLEEAQSCLMCIQV